MKFLLLILVVGCILLFRAKKSYRKQGEPLNEITRCMQEASNGNLTSRTTYDKNDEIGYLSVEFNKMMDKLDTQVNRIIEMEIQLKKAQIMAYESQINPHFLYNTLDLIRMMSVSNDVDKIEETIVSLASMLRYNLSSQTEVKISDEIKNIEDYFKILSMRFGEKFEYNIDVDDKVKDCKILKFIIQPLVENSMKHGIGRMDRTGFVEVSCKAVGDEIAIVVSDNGVGMTEEEIEILKNRITLDKGDDEHIGLKNIYKRIFLYYGEKSVFEIYSEKNKNTKVLLRVPFIQKEERENV